MGMLGYFAHRSSKKNIKKNIEWCRRLNPDQRAGMIFYVWLIRGMNLGGLMGNKSLFIPIYYYTKGAEAVLVDVVKAYSGNASMSNAAHHHLYTNLAVSYPDEGYGPLVREMWRVLLDNHTDLKEVVGELSPILREPAFEEMVQQNDVSVERLIDDAKSIMPHFLVPGHPLSVKLMEDDKIGKYILGE